MAQCQTADCDSALSDNEPFERWMGAGSQDTATRANIARQRASGKCNPRVWIWAWILAGARGWRISSPGARPGRVRWGIDGPIGVRRCPALPALLISLALAEAALAEVDFEPIKQRAGAEAFAAACGPCHTPDASGQSVGPPLEDVAGRIAGGWAGYPYSDALKTAGFVWTDAALRAWMEDNTAFLPGTRMRHDGIADPVVQDLILAYLHSISMGD